MKLIIAINIPAVSTDQFKADRADWMQGEKVIVDEAYLQRAQDDSFFAFDLIAVRPT